MKAFGTLVCVGIVVLLTLFIHSMANAGAGEKKMPAWNCPDSYQERIVCWSGGKIIINECSSHIAEKNGGFEVLSGVHMNLVTGMCMHQKSP